MTAIIISAAFIAIAYLAAWYVTNVVEYVNREILNRENEY